MKNQLVIMQAFYNVDKISLKSIDSNKLLGIIETSKRINRLYLDETFRENKTARYLRIMELIHSNYSRTREVKNHYATKSQEEKLLLFMFSVDPNFEMAIIYASEDRTNEIKRKIREKFGIYDPCLIKIEKAFIKNLLTKEKQNEINKEIERRAFK